MSMANRIEQKAKNRHERRWLKEIRRRAKKLLRRTGGPDSRPRTTPDEQGRIWGAALAEKVARKSYFGRLNLTIEEPASVRAPDMWEALREAQDRDEGPAVLPAEFGARGRFEALNLPERAAFEEILAARRVVDTFGVEASTLAIMEILDAAKAARAARVEEILSRGKSSDG
jgi:hypothetical protein